MTKKRPKDVSPDVRLIVNWANGTIGTSDHVDVRDPRIREPNSDGEKSNFWKDTEVKLAKTEMDVHFQKVKVSFTLISSIAAVQSHRCSLPENAGVNSFLFK